MNNLEKKLQHALQENELLKEEINKLKEVLKQRNIPYPSGQPKQVHQGSKDEIINERMNIFKSLFRGRTDVYAKRWEYNGKTGYSPARVYDPDKNYKDRELLPLNDKVLYDHLSGRKTVGIYPMLKDETCWFLAVDFDKEQWKEDAWAFVNACKELSVPANIEISRSGNGCHVWIFFNERVAAKTARKLGNLLLNRTLEKRYQTGIDSFNRLFPNQDTLPKGGFGNLIALPLQHQPRKNGCSVFVDENFTPYSDQWEYLSSVKTLNKNENDSIIRKNYREEKQVVNSSQTKYEIKAPKEVKLIYKNGIHIPKKVLPSNIMNQLTQLAVFNNPEFYKAQSKRLSTFRIPRKIDCTDETEDYLILPRGCMDDVKTISAEHKINVTVEEQTNKGNPINIQFHGKLSPQQEEAAKALLNHECGILSATTGFGKTVIAASLIARRQVNTLVIVHRKQLIGQWKERLAAFLDTSIDDIGQIGGGKNKATGFIDIATIQSLNYNGVVKDDIKNYGQIIVDECHHISAFSFESVLKKAEAAYVHGLTATPTRKDGLHKIMTMQCGPIRYTVSAKDQAKVRPFEHVLVPRFTSFKTNEEKIQAVYSSLVKDEKRNEMIFNDVLEELDNGARPVILTERVEHVEKLNQQFRGFAKNIIVLTGGMNKKDEESRLKKLESISDDEERLVIATGKYIGEGFDNNRLDTLFLAMPIAWKGTLQQYVGRLHRLHDDKNVVKVYDYVDHRVRVLKSMFEKRLKGYKSMGYRLEDDSSGNGFGQQMKLF
ncbi:TOTE conflict system archaeo-eukaryotic primase domain-containing protein [Virgibacillus doumboii]|uniref:TOTE conflict system archaeo-eukaryotic primase domain-containing protein n=1 Tax=Virgibacillus doumboii TaxID=2697503 RepID=UPI0013DEB8DD|nr:DEAD/DEAH box helicase [Virgibacillus doumboii]